MEATIDTTQSVIIPEQTDRMDLVNQINARLVALSRLGSRYGGKGDGFYIRTVRFDEIFEFRDGTEFFIAVLQPNQICKIKELAGTDVTAGAKDEYMAGIITDAFGSLGAFLVGYGISEEYDIRIKMSKTAAMQFLYSTATGNPVILYDALYIPASSFTYASGEPVFKDSFTVALSAYAADLDENPGPAFDYKAEISGIGVTDEGILTYNGHETDILIHGKDGSDSQTVIIFGERSKISEYEYCELAVDISVNGEKFGAPEGTINSLAVVSEGPEDNLWIDIEGNPVKLLMPSDAFLDAFSGSGRELRKGATVFSFLKETDGSAGHPTVFTGILVYKGGNSFEPVFTGNGVFTFGSLFTSSALSNDICEELEKYFSGSQTRENEYFSFEKIRFGPSSQTMFQTARNDTSVTGSAPTGRFTLSLGKNEVGDMTHEPLPVLMVKYSESDNFRNLIKDPDIFSAVTQCTQFNKGYKYDNDASMNTVLPVIYLNDVSLFCPNVINSIRVYGAGSDCGATSANIPFLELKGGSYIWGTLSQNGEETPIVSTGIDEYNGISVFKETGFNSISKICEWESVKLLVKNPQLNEITASGEGLKFEVGGESGKRMLQVSASGLQTSDDLVVRNETGMLLTRGRLVKLFPKYKSTRMAISSELNTPEGERFEESVDYIPDYEETNVVLSYDNGIWSYAFAGFSEGAASTYISDDTDIEANKDLPLIRVETKFGVWIVDIGLAVSLGYANLEFNELAGNTDKRLLKNITLAFVDEIPVCKVDSKWLVFRNIDELFGEHRETVIYP